MANRKPPPLYPSRPHNLCPVCGEVSYSHAGVHPQCAMQKADAERLERIKREKPVTQPVRSASSIQPWQKLCPKCRSAQHVRRKTCTCGHTFAVPGQPPTDADELA